MAFFGGGGASAGIGGSTGATDNAILRADGTGAATLQNSDLLIDDAVVPFSITGNAATDVITAVGHNFTNNQWVVVLSITGGSGITATTTKESPTLYQVKDISGDTFRLYQSWGPLVDFTTNITAGSIVAILRNVTIRNNNSETESSVVITPKGNGAFILGAKPDGTGTGGNLRGDRAVDLQIGRDEADKARVASGDRSCVLGGFSNGASASGAAVAGGFYNLASARWSNVSGGYSNSTFGEQSSVCGGQENNSSAFYSSILGGFRALSDRYCLQAHAAGRFSSVGDAQRIRAVLRCKTTTNAAVEMALDGGTTYLTIPSGKVIFCNIKVVGVRSTGADVATYERQYAAKNVAGTSSEVFAPVTIGTDNASGTTLEVATVDAGDYIRIRPTGVASQTWRWVASVDAVEVAYGT